MVESVYSAVRSDSLYESEYVSSLKVFQVRYNSSFLIDLVDFGTKFPKLLAELTILMKVT